MRRLKLLGIAVLASATTVLIAPASAEAATTACPSNNTCIWGDIHWATIGYSGDLVQTNTYWAHLNRTDYQGTGLNANDSASSNYDQSTAVAWYYEDPSCTGWAFTSQPYTGDSDFTNGTPTDGSGSSFNDKLTAMALYGSGNIANCGNTP